MTEQEVVERFLVEMQSFSQALRQRLERISSSASPNERAATVRELHGLADAMATLCASFHITDCASLGTALAAAFKDSSATTPSREVASAAASALDAIEQRIQQMAMQRRVLTPTETESVAAAELAAQLTRAGSPSNNHAGTTAYPAVDAAAQQDTTAGNMAELVRRFQASSLKRREPSSQPPIDDAFPAQWDPKLGIHVT